MMILVEIMGEPLLGHMLDWMVGRRRQKGVVRKTIIFWR